MSQGRTLLTLPLDELVGSSADSVFDRLGPPGTDRRVGDDRWLVYECPGLSLRIRCHLGARSSLPSSDPSSRSAAGPQGRIASWTATFRRGIPTLREATEPLGLWPGCGPDEVAADESTLICRAVPSPDGREARSLTATVRDGLIIQVTVFDEPPEWESEAP